MFTTGSRNLEKTVVELEYQTRLNTLILEWMLNNHGGVLTPKEIEDFKEKASNFVNNRFGENVISYQRPMAVAQ